MSQYYTSVIKIENANEIRIGKSTYGKTFSIKKTIIHHLEKGDKVFIFDTNGEYVELCKQLGGVVVDMSSTELDGEHAKLCNYLGGEVIDETSVKGVSINPFEINFSFDEEIREYSNTKLLTQSEITRHIQFLEQWFELIFPDMNILCRTMLIKKVLDLYEKGGITKNTNLNHLKHSDYPLMVDLYKIILEEYNNAEKEYKVDYKKIKEQLETFMAESWFSKLWNRHTSINISNDFTVFNFQNLFANLNKTVAIGQMSLLMRKVMQEIIENKKNNDLQKTKGLPTNNVVVVVDEAHMFVNSKETIGLKMMRIFTKHIHKYDGKLLVGTSNLEDFMGDNPNTVMLASAVINTCQYSTIFNLTPDDLNKLIKLYRGTFFFTQKELEYIASAKIGEALIIGDITTNIKTKFEMYDIEKEIIERKKQ